MIRKILLYWAAFEAFCLPFWLIVWLMPGKFHLTLWQSLIMVHVTIGGILGFGVGVGALLKAAIESE
jgi:hypothetical protein